MPRLNNVLEVFNIYFKHIFSPFLNNVNMIYLFLAYVYRMLNNVDKIYVCVTNWDINQTNLLDEKYYFYFYIILKIKKMQRRINYDITNL